MLVKETRAQARDETAMGRAGQTPGRHQTAKEGDAQGQGVCRLARKRRRDKKGHSQQGHVSTEGSAESPS